MKRLLIGIVICAAVIGIVFSVFTILKNPERRLTQTYLYDASIFTNAAELPAAYVETARIPSTDPELRGVAVGPGDHIYSVGTFLTVTSSNGTQVYRVPLAAPATCVAVSDNGTIYIGMTDHIECYDATGGFLSAWTSLGSTAIVTSIALALPDVYAADAGNRVVVRYDDTGNVRTLIGQKNTEHGIPGFVIPSPYFDVAIGTDNSLWVVNPGLHEFENFVRDGTLRTAWQRRGLGLDGFCGCCNPSHMAIQPDGSIVTAEKAIARVKICEPDGALRCLVAGPDQFAEGTVGLDVAVDSHGQILVLDPVARAIRIFTQR